MTQYYNLCLFLVFQFFRGGEIRNARVDDSFIKKNLSISSGSFDSLATFDCVGARAADI